MAISVEDLKRQLLATYAKEVPRLDLTEGSTERDIFIEAPIDAIYAPVVNQLNSLELFYTILDNPDLVPEGVVDEFVSSNFGITRVPATPSVGVAQFYTRTQPDPSINIPVGTVIQTRDGKIQYITISNPLGFVATSDGRWVFNVNIRSIGVGPGFGVGANSLTVIQNPIVGIEGVTNISPIADGRPAESNSELLNRVKRAFLGRTIDSVAGLEQFVSTFHPEFRILSYGDPGFVRSMYPKAIDIYFPQEDEEVAIQTVILPYPNYLQPIIFERQPVIYVADVTLITSTGQVVLEESDYSLIKDTGILSQSTRSVDYLQLQSSVTGKSLRITYYYNAFLQNVQNAFESNEVKKYGRDVLIRRANKIVFNLLLDYVPKPGYTVDDLDLAIITEIRSFVNNLRMGENLQWYQMYVLVNEVEGVLSVDFDSFEFQIVSGGGQISADKSIVVQSMDYLEFNELVHV
ncbi:MAG: baseplate J/gp47 family protein [candidate division WOR-3 bacterium]